MFVCCKSYSFQDECKSIKKIKVSKMYVVLLSGKLDKINSIKLLVLPLLGGIL